MTSRDDIDSLRAYDSLNAKAKKLISLVKPILIDFGMSVWGKSEEWSWTENPKDCIIPYAWIGVISKNKGCRSSDPLDGSGRFGVILEADNTLRVLAFQEFIYQHLKLDYGTSTVALYLCRVEVSVESVSATESVRRNLEKIHQYLIGNPISFVTQQYDLEPMEVDEDIGDSIRYTLKVIDRWHPPW